MDKSIKKLSLPNFFVVGAAKAGTTSLYHHLKIHPEIYMSPIKEPHHFGTDIDPHNFNSDYKKTFPSNLDKYLNSEFSKEILLAYIKNWEDYKKLFKNVIEEKAIGEISNSYLYSSVAANEIKRKIQNPKIIIILRNPVERAFSHYVMDLRMGLIKVNFRKALEDDLNKALKGWGISHLYIELGLYFEQVKRFLDVFPREQVLILLFDEIKHNPENVYGEIFNFLGVQSNVCSDLRKKHNQAALPKTGISYLNYLATKLGFRKFANQYFSEGIKNSIKTMMYSKNKKVFLRESDWEFLMDVYNKDIENLSGLIGRNLSHWNEQ